MPTTHPRYLTYSTEELEATLHALDDTPGRATALALTLKQGGNGPFKSTSGSRLLKSHTCLVLFPDNIAGHCAYTRYGPTYHLFQFQHGGEGTGFTPVALPRLYFGQTLGNDTKAIEAKVNELAQQAYAQAALWEQKDYFARATENHARKKRPDCFQMTAARAKELAGKYAVCFRLGNKWLPIKYSHNSLGEANRDWEMRHCSNPVLVVACCNRLDRCWELPRFNVLYATFDSRLGNKLGAEGSVAETGGLP